jgi:endonuclease/exonuclease/phosphatase family metal-dependent hydrolase
LLFLVYFVGVLSYATFTKYKPEAIEKALQEINSENIIETDTLSLLIWNTGYAGLGDNMDFFYDHGKKVRDTEERTIENLDNISNFLKEKAFELDFLMLQEVDFNSKRSYNINQYEKLKSSLSELLPNSFKVINYLVNFVPVPISEPMGKTNGGLVSFSKYLPHSAERISLPNIGTTWPDYLFQLDRCLLVKRFKVNHKEGKDLVVINVHNSAYEGAEKKDAEMDFIKKLVEFEYEKGNYIVLGGDWNQLPPNVDVLKFANNYEKEDIYANNLAFDLFDERFNYVYEPLKSTNRSLRKPYLAKDTYQCLIDFYLISDNILALEIETFDLGFKNSDHQPVYLKLKLN